MNLEDACAFLETTTDHLRHFREIDPYNNILVEGYLCNEPDERYGALLIDQVDGIEQIQLVLPVPKMHYPHDKQGHFRWPPTREIQIYNKIDGTSVLAFSYRSGRHQFVSHKTRLMPFIGDRRNGPFKTYWDQMLERYPLIPDAVLASGCNLAFELYGGLNRHLIKYDVPLDVAYLFAIDQEGHILPPRVKEPWPPAKGFPEDTFELAVKRPEDLTAFYNYWREQKEAGLTKTADGYEGSEGSVWYLRLDNGSWLPTKAKPESVELIHWSAGGIPKEVIKHACYRALENTDELLGYEDVAAILGEDLSADQLEAGRDRILKVAGEINLEIGLRTKAAGLYKELGVTLAEDKGTVLRALSHHFDRGQMSRVYFHLAMMDGLLAKP